MIFTCRYLVNSLLGSTLYVLKYCSILKNVHETLMYLMTSLAKCCFSNGVDNLQNNQLKCNLTGAITREKIVFSFRW